MKPERRFTFSSNLTIFGDNMNKISDVISDPWQTLSSILLQTNNKNYFDNNIRSTS